MTFPFVADCVRAHLFLLGKSTSTVYSKTLFDYSLFYLGSGFYVRVVFWFDRHCRRYRDQGSRLGLCGVRGTPDHGVLLGAIIVATSKRCAQPTEGTRRGLFSSTPSEPRPRPRSSVLTERLDVRSSSRLRVTTVGPIFTIYVLSTFYVHGLFYDLRYFTFMPQV